MSNFNDQWLVRTKENKIQGPFTLIQARELIMSRSLGPSDEICKANAYWMILRERDEVGQALGMDLPLWGADDDEEPTATGTTDTITRRIDFGGGSQTAASRGHDYPGSVKKPYQLERASMSQNARFFLLLCGIVLVMALWRLLQR